MHALREVDMVTRRCEWCGCFVPASLKQKAWRVNVGAQSRQNPRSPWNYWTRLVCDGCLPPSRSLSWWQSVTVAEVERRRARGWPGVVRSCQ